MQPFDVSELSWASQHTERTHSSGTKLKMVTGIFWTCELCTDFLKTPEQIKVTDKAHYTRTLVIGKKML